MKIQSFFEHHGIATNPFSDEDAQTDLVFKGYCIRQTYHPTWDKIYGNPGEPATAIVFGEKGSGKTALRLQIARHLGDYNADHADARAFVVEYADFNPFLDRFRDRFSSRRRRRPERILEEWKLWDHMDAVLSQSVTQLIDRILDPKQASSPSAVDTTLLPVKNLERSQVRDLLVLAACYDQSTATAGEDRWRKLRRKLRFSTWRRTWVIAVPILVTAAVFGTIGYFRAWEWLSTVWPYLAVGAGFLPWIWRCMKSFWRANRITKNTRVLIRNPKRLRRILSKFADRQIVGQPLPNCARSDDRYEQLVKLQDILGVLGFSGMIVLVDRVDEPYLINGSADLMRALIWPMLDNKLLKHPGLGLKLLLPADLVQFVDREDRDFHQRARLDKQNLIRSLDWTGESLFDVANARIKGCAIEGQSPALVDLFDDSVDNARLLAAMRDLRVPRHLFKFLYRLIVAHTNAHTDDSPVWKISGETFQSVLSVYQREEGGM